MLTSKLVLEVDTSGIDVAQSKLRALSESLALAQEAAKALSAEAQPMQLSGFAIDPLESAITETVRLVEEATGDLARRLSRHLDRLLDIQIDRASNVRDGATAE